MAKNKGKASSNARRGGGAKEMTDNSSQTVQIDRIETALDNTPSPLPPQSVQRGHSHQIPMTTFIDADPSMVTRYAPKMPDQVASTSFAGPSFTTNPTAQSSHGITWPTPMGLEAMEQMETQVENLSSSLNAEHSNEHVTPPRPPTTSFHSFDSPEASTTASSSKSTLAQRSTSSTSHARKRREGHIKRPPNAFILFRSHAYANNLIPNHLEVKDHREVSRIIAHMWNSLPTQERAEWTAQAQKEKVLHQLRYPEYRYKPEMAADREGPKLKRKLKQSADVAEKCEAIADNILKSYGRQGIQTTVSESKAGKSRRRKKDDLTDEVVTSQKAVKGSARSTKSRSKAKGKARKQDTSDSNAASDEVTANDGPAAAQAIDAIVDRSLARMRALSVTREAPPIVSPAPSFDELMSILASDAAQSQAAVDVGQPTAELLASWNTELSHAAGLAAGSNIYAHPFAPSATDQHVALPAARSFSNDSTTLTSEENRTKTKRRPERLNLIDNQATQRRTDENTIPMQPPPLSAARLWNFYGASYMDYTNNRFLPQPPKPNVDDDDAQLHLFDIRSARVRTSSALRRPDNQDAMLVSPMITSFADQRQRMRLLTEAKQQQHLENVRQRSRVLQAADVALPVMQPRTANVALNSAASNTFAFPLTPASATALRYESQPGTSTATRARFALSEGLRRPSVGFDMMCLSPRLNALDLELRSAGLSTADDPLCHFPITPATSLFNTVKNTSTLEDISVLSSDIIPMSASRMTTGLADQGTITNVSHPVNVSAPSTITDMDIRLAYSAAPVSASKSVSFAAAARRKSIGARYASDHGFFNFVRPNDVGLSANLSPSTGPSLSSTTATNQHQT